MSEQAQAEKKVAVGACEEISEKNGWTSFAVNVGTQYPVRLQTKLPAIIEQARAVGGEVATWHYKESQGNPNPNRPGEFYKNKYLESVEAGGATITPPAGGSAPAPQQRPVESAHGPVSLGDKDRLISRQVCLKAAASLVAPLAAEDPALEAMKAAKRFEQWLYRDIDPLPSSSGAETPQPPAAPDRGPDNTPDYDPDDVPF